MKIRNYNEVEALEIMEGVKKRVVIGPDEGAPNFIMRIFDVETGFSTPCHDHRWEHEIFIINGEGTARDGDGVETPFREGDTIFIPPNERHCVINTGKATLHFMCLIPTGVDIR